MVVDHDLRVPARGDEDGVDAAGQGRREDVRDLEADEVRKGYDDGRETAVAVVCWLREDEVQVGQEGARKGDEHGAKGQHRADEAFLSDVSRRSQAHMNTTKLTLTSASMPRSLIIFHVSLAA